MDTEPGTAAKPEQRIRNGTTPSSAETSGDQQKLGHRVSDRLKQLSQRPIRALKALASGALTRNDRTSGIKRDADTPVDHPDVAPSEASWTPEMTQQVQAKLEELWGPDFGETQFQVSVPPEGTPKNNETEVDIDKLVAQAVVANPEVSFLTRENPENIRKVVELVQRTRTHFTERNPDKPPISDRRILALAVSKIRGQGQEGAHSEGDVAADYRARIIKAFMSKPGGQLGELPF